LFLETKYITFHETKCEAFQIINSDRYQTSLIEGNVKLGLNPSSSRNKYNLLLPQAFFLRMVRIEDPFNLLQIPAPCLNKRKVYHNSTKSIKQNVKDVKAPRDRSNSNRRYVRVDDEYDISRQVVEGKAFSASVESQNF